MLLGSLVAHSFAMFTPLGGLTSVAPLGSVRHVSPVRVWLHWAVGPLAHAIGDVGLHDVHWYAVFATW